jgi:cardiolipin synthase (CMP-forming)
VSGALSEGGLFGLADCSEGLVWLASIILGRDVGLGIAAIYYRYISLPPPKTFSRYWDFSLPSAEVHPTTISKVRLPLPAARLQFSPSLLSR